MESLRFTPMLGLPFKIFLDQNWIKFNLHLGCVPDAVTFGFHLSSLHFFRLDIPTTRVGIIFLLH